MSDENNFPDISRPSPEDNTPDPDYTEAATEYFVQKDEGDVIDPKQAQQRLDELGIITPNTPKVEEVPVDDESVIDLDAWRKRKR